MAHIKFRYLYRDSSNYKNFGSIVFAGSENCNLFELLLLIQSKLIDDTWFYAAQWHLPDLHFGTWDDESGHIFHEFECVEYTNEAPNTLLTLAAFKAFLEQTNRT